MKASKFSTFALIAIIALYFLSHKEVKASPLKPVDCKFYEGLNGKVAVYNSLGDAYLLNPKTGEKNFDIKNIKALDFVRLSRELVEKNPSFLKIYYPSDFGAQNCDMIFLKVNPYMDVKLKSLKEDLFTQITAGNMIGVYKTGQIFNSEFDDVHDLLSPKEARKRIEIEKIAKQIEVEAIEKDLKNDKSNLEIEKDLKWVD